VLSPDFPHVGVPVLEVGVTPVPIRVNVEGELVALLATATLPLALPDAAGAKVTLRVAVCPGVSVCPVDKPVASNPAPETLTFEIDTSEFPAFVNVTF